MVFPDSNPKKSWFLVLYDDKYGNQYFKWLDDINQVKEEISRLNDLPAYQINFAGEIAILKDLTNS